MIKSIFRFTFWTLLLVLLVTAGLIGVQHFTKKQQEKAIYGSIVNNPESLPTTTLQTPNFEVTWNADQRVLQIWSDQTERRLEWSSIPGESFVHLTADKDDFKEVRGSFFIKQQVRKKYPLQFVEYFMRVEEQLRIGGRLYTQDPKTYVFFELRFEETDSQRLKFELITDATDEVNRVFLTYATAANEKFFGFGTQFSHFNMKGKRLPIWVSEQGIGRGRQPLTWLVDRFAKSGGKWYTSYAPSPHYITSKLRSLYLSTYEYAVFDLRHAEKVQISLRSNTMHGEIISGESPIELIEAYTEFAGRMPPLPDWFNRGAVIGMQGGTDKVYDVWKKLDEANTPIAAFWLQDWVGQRKTSFGKQLWWNWELDRDHYPNWDSLRLDLLADSIQVMGYINPFLIDPSDKPNVRKDFLKDASLLQILAKDSTREFIEFTITDFPAYLVDVSHPIGRQFLVQTIRDHMMTEGLSGWMADFGEAYPMEAVPADRKVSAYSYHNKFPETWAAVNKLAVAADTVLDLIYFNRSGYSRSPQLNRLFWLGDQLVSWDEHDGIKTAVTGLLSSGLSGFSLNHSDIGGYTTLTNKPLNIVRSPELLKRWTELNAFTAAFRTHEGNRPEVNAQVYDDEASVEHFARFARLFARLAPYRKQLMHDAHQRGLPLVRHPFIHYPDITELQDITYEQFMLGPDVMVAPVLDPDTDQVEIFLPEGNWVRAFDNILIESRGATFTVDTPIGKPAVFYKEGSEVGKYLILD